MIKVYLVKLVTDTSADGQFDDIVDRIWRDPCSHSLFAEAVEKVSIHIRCIPGFRSLVFT